MKHRVGFNRLGRSPSHRKALHRNMVTSLLKHERIRTTKAKALAVRRTAEKMITRAKLDSVHNRRMVGRDIKDKAILAKLFLEIGPRYKERPGGYTRVLKIGYRQGDASEMVLLELVNDAAQEGARKGSKSSGDKKSDDRKTDGRKRAAPERRNEAVLAAAKKRGSASVTDEAPPDPADETTVRDKTAAGRKTSSARRAAAKPEEPSQNAGEAAE